MTIPQDAYYVPLEATYNQVVTPVNYSDVVVLLESTIGIYGTGLLDAIPDDSLKAEYARQEKAGVKLIQPSSQTESGLHSIRDLQVNNIPNVILTL